MRGIVEPYAPHATDFFVYERDEKQSSTKSRSPGVIGILRGETVACEAHIAYNVDST